jgi:hypothetical protein
MNVSQIFSQIMDVSAFYTVSDRRSVQVLVIRVRRQWELSTKDERGLRLISRGNTGKLLFSNQEEYKNKPMYTNNVYCIITCAAEAGQNKKQEWQV